MLHSYFHLREVLLLLAVEEPPRFHNYPLDHPQFCQTEEIDLATKSCGRVVKCGIDLKTKDVKKFVNPCTHSLPV